MRKQTWKDLYGPPNATLDLLDELGLGPVGAKQFRRDTVLQQRLGKFLKDGGIPVLPEAEQLIGDYVPVFGSRHWARTFSSPTDEQLANCPSASWIQHELNKPCPFFDGMTKRQTHVVFRGLSTIKDRPTSVKNLADLCDASRTVYFGCRENNRGSWYDTATLEDRWYFMLKVPAPLDKMGYEEQLRLLPNDYSATSMTAAFLCRAASYAIDGHLHGLGHVSSWVYSGRTTDTTIFREKAFVFALESEPAQPAQLRSSCLEAAWCGSNIGLWVEYLPPSQDKP